jgi:5-methylcytosine-specific restriction endonuclease McrA
MTRAVDEWIGKTHDSAIPPRVKVRIFERHQGICHLTKRRIRAGEAWDCDHVIALCNGGEHREGNLAPALRQPHREKTAEDVRVKSKIARIRKRHLGIATARRPMPGSKASGWKKRMDGTVVRRSGRP